MSLEDIDEKFLHSNTADEILEEELQEEIETLLETETRQQVLDELDVLSPEIRERAEEILEQVVFQEYSEEIRSGQELDQQVEDAAEELRQFSEERRKNVLSALSPKFRKAVEELLED